MQTTQIDIGSASPLPERHGGCTRGDSGMSEGGALDTLAKVVQNPSEAKLKGGTKEGISSGEVEEQQKANLQKRARSKFFSHELAWRLTKLRGELEQSYLNTVYCAGTIVQEDGAMRSRYCGNRWCLVCNRIRIARAINTYQPIIAEWEDTQFITLTVRNVPAEQLEETIQAMQDDWYAIIRAMRRTDGMDPKVVRKLECTYSAKRGDYHPHFHAIVEGKAEAERIVERWLKRHRESAEPAGQDCRPTDPKSALELFKYFTKLVATVKDKDGQEERRVMPAEALDTIFQAMRRKHVFRPYGFQIEREEEEAIEGEELETDASPAFKRLEEQVFWIWEQDMADWVDMSTGECLSEYEPGERYRAFVENIDPSRGESGGVVVRLAKTDIGEHVGKLDAPKEGSSSQYERDCTQGVYVRHTQEPLNHLDKEGD